MNDWVTVNLGEHCKIRTGKKDVNEGNPFGRFPFFTCSKNISHSENYSFDTEAILIAGNGDVGNLHYYNGKFEAYQRTYILDSFNINIHYIYQYLEGNLLKALQKDKIGTSIPYIKLNHLSEFPVYLPKCTFQQKRIASILLKTDQIIEKTAALIEKYQQVKAGLMHDLFTRGITADGKLRPTREQAPELYKETSIGWIAKEWASDKFGAHISVIDPNPSHRYPPEVDKGYPICSTENFHGEDGYIFKKTKLVPSKTFQSQQIRCQFKENDVIFARKGKIGLARRYGKDKKVFSHTVVLMKPATSKVDPNWLLWLSRSNWLLIAIDVTMNTNSGVPTLGVEFIKDITVPFPPINEQEQINKSLDAISEKIQSEIEKKEKLLKHKTGLMHDLLTGKVSVKAEEPEAAYV